MKINDYLLSQSLNQTSTTTQTEKSGMDFSEILGQTVGKAQDGTSETAGSATAMSGLGGTDPVSQLVLYQASQGEASTQVDQALTTLERFAEALGDPQKSLKDINGLVSDMKDEAAQLSELSETLPEGQDMKTLANQVAVLMTVEATKFDRGDYV